MTYFVAASHSNAANRVVGLPLVHAVGGRLDRPIADSYGFVGRSRLAVTEVGVNSDQAFAVECENFVPNASAAFANFYRSKPVAGVNAGRLGPVDGESSDQDASLAAWFRVQVSFAFHGPFPDRHHVFRPFRDRDLDRRRGHGPAHRQ